MVDSIEQADSDADYRILIGSGFQSPDREAVAVDTFLQLRVDGLILTGSNIPISEIEKAAEAVPVVLASRSAASDAVDSVVVDDRAGAIMAVEHLIQLGHRRRTGRRKTSVLTVRHIEPGCTLDESKYAYSDGDV